MASGSRPVRLLGTVVGLALLATNAAAAPAGAASGGAAPTEAAPAADRPRDCVEASTWVRAELVDRHGAPSGQFVDSRCTNRTLTARFNSRFHYVRHVGRDALDAALGISYFDGTWGTELSRESTAVDDRARNGPGGDGITGTVARPSGGFVTAPVDVMPMLAMSGALTVVVDHTSVRTLQDLTEYGIALAVSGGAACGVGVGAPAWVRAMVVDRHGTPNGLYVDSRCAQRTLIVSMGTRFRYVRHVGLDVPGTLLDITFVDPASTTELRRETATPTDTGLYVQAPIDLAGLVGPDGRVAVGIHHAAPALLQDLIEYVLLAG
jgi:hypothetical protein